jgi:adenine C2-methylase RlmN of 23S rRNA A2503 and tRNA A37
VRERDAEIIDGIPCRKLESNWSGKAKAYRAQQWTKWYYEEKLRIAKDLVCVELAVVTILQQRAFKSGSDTVKFGNRTLGALGFSGYQKLRVLRRLEQSGHLEIVEMSPSTVVKIRWKWR